MPQERTRNAERAPTTVIERLVTLASLAPSVHNTQPWRWEYDDHRLTLHADDERRLLAEDPHGRNLTLSCGAALHHLQFAAQAMGWETTVRRLPDPSDPSLLAEVTVQRHQRHPVHPADIELLRERCTDRRRFTAWPVPGDRLDALCRAAASWGVEARSVTDDAARFRLELLANQALTELEFDNLRRAEQDRWIGHTGTDGIPRDLLPSAPDPLQARSRFEPELLEDTRLALQGSDRVIALGTTTDDVGSWLRVGEAMSAAWLQAGRLGLSVVPLSQPIEIDSVRDEITRGILGDAFRPHVLLRVGWQAMGRRELPRTPRRPLAEVFHHRAHPGAEGPVPAGNPAMGRALAGS